MLEPGDINEKNTWRLFKLAVSSRDEVGRLAEATQ